MGSWTLLGCRERIKKERKFANGDGWISTSQFGRHHNE